MTILKIYIKLLFHLFLRITQAILIFGVAFDLFKGYVELQTIVDLLLIVMVELKFVSDREPNTNLTVKDLTLNIDKPSVVNSYGSTCQCGACGSGDSLKSTVSRTPKKAVKITK